VTSCADICLKWQEAAIRATPSRVAPLAKQHGASSGRGQKERVTETTGSVTKQKPEILTFE